MGSSPEITLPPAADYALRLKMEFSSGWEQWFWIQGDVHFDSPEYLAGLHKRHLEEAAAVDAMIIDGGDHFDVISTRSDPRGTKGTIRPEHARADYLDAIVEDAVDKFGKYADRFIYFGTGNHEAKIMKVCETDLTTRFVRDLNSIRSKKLQPIYRAGYGGWIRFEFRGPGGGNHQSYSMKIFHGSGGGGKVTKGVIQSHRRNADIDGADIVTTFHIHESWRLETLKEYLNPMTGRVQVKECRHLQIGSYKMDFRTDGDATWHTMREGGPKPIGGCFIRFFSPNGRSVYWEERRPHIDYSALK